jgi:serine/threonine-protein kinase
MLGGAQGAPDSSSNRGAHEEEALSDGSNYEILSVLGEGGMARVLKARDRDLDRLVALKVLRADVPVSVGRLLNEARAQARVVHDHVCRVYEVGRFAEGPFIAMQLVDGKPLQAVARELDLRERLVVFCDIADAIEAAHASGLLHRDLKPANVLVERRGGGSHAYVTDFGLARDLLKPGSTVQGALIGSPLYMAPEQADPGARLDARTDVYALGATLYELLVGRPPFLGASSLQVLYRTLHEDPVPPRKLDSSLHVALERVVLQCLEKATARRYPSAATVADDVRRYLRGEAVRARRYGAIRRARRLVARHPSASLLSVAVLVLVATLVASGIVISRREQGAAAAARSFAERVQAAETAVRLGSLLPLHDLRRERAMAREHLAAIERQIASLRPELAALGHAALGRGYLSLEEYGRAREHLELAVRSGRASAPDRYALGLALGELYAHELGRAQTMGGSKARKARAKDLEDVLRAPALSYLRGTSASGGEQAPEYVEALIAYYERRYDDALAKARAGFARAPALYESKKLEGDVLAGRARDAAMRGERERSTSDFEAAGAAYAAASEIARSDPAIYEADCQRHALALQMEIVAGIDPNHTAVAGAIACDRALAANPDSGEARHIAARIHFRVAEWRNAHGQNPAADAREALGLSEAALQRDPNDVEAWRTTGAAWTELGVYEDLHAPDSRPSFERVIAAAQEALRIEPGYAEFFNMAGLAHMSIAVWEFSHGIDPMPRLQQTSAALRRAIELDDDNHSARINLGSAEMLLAQTLFGEGKDPGAALDEVDRLSGEVLERFPASPSVASILCTAATVRGMESLRRGSTPEAAFESGFARCKGAIRPGVTAWGLSARAELTVEWGKALVARGHDPALVLADGEAALAEADRRDPENPEVLRLRAEAAVVTAQWAIQKRRNPAGLFGAAERDANRAIAISPSFDYAYRSLARLDAARLEWRRRSPALAAVEARRGLRDVRRALEVHPGWPELLALETLFKSVR